MWGVWWLSGSLNLLLQPVPLDTRRGPKEPDLAQLLGWALSHWVSDSLMDRFMGVLMMRFKLREGSSLSVGNYIQDWGGHKSDFHNVTQYGSKICHATVTGVTCDTTHRQL